MKLSGFDFWHANLQGARYIVAPMVDQSELAWRLLCRKYGADLCYTPMLHASVFIRDANYRKESLATCKEDRPLIVQFCANDPETLLKAAKYVEHLCDAVDINLGCPQSIAKRGHYGAFLQDEWELLSAMVEICAKRLKVPVTCKIRVFEDLEKSIRYAQMLENAGAQLLTVHGRTREQKGAQTGLANWDYITEIRKSVKIPVFANGNIQYFEDIQRCLTMTGAIGIMSAEGNLHNPALFANLEPPAWQMSEEYLDFVEQHPCPMSYVRGHLFKLLHHMLLRHLKFRDELGCCKDIIEARKLIHCLKDASSTDMETYNKDPTSYNLGNLPRPYWICQPYVRPDLCQTTVEERLQFRESIKRPLELLNGTPLDQSLSRNKLKKLRRNSKKNFDPKPDKFEKCTCANPKGLRCVFDLCRSCCRCRAFRNNVSCPGHRLQMKPRVEQPVANDEEVVDHVID